jgi:hypothetical protein
MVVIHMVRGLDSATRIENRLKEEGFFVRIRPVYKTLDETENYFEIKVLASELQEARELLMDGGFM